MLAGEFSHHTDRLHYISWCQVGVELCVQRLLQPWGFKEFKSHLSAGFSSAAAHYSHSHLDLFAICVTGCPTGCHHYLCITT